MRHITTRLAHTTDAAGHSVQIQAICDPDEPEHGLYLRVIGPAIQAMLGPFTGLDLCDELEGMARDIRIWDADQDRREREASP